MSPSSGAVLLRCGSLLLAQRGGSLQCRGVSAFRGTAVISHPPVTKRAPSARSGPLVRVQLASMVWINGLTIAVVDCRNTPLGPDAPSVSLRPADPAPESQSSPTTACRVGSSPLG